MADPVVGRITKNGRRAEDEEKPDDIQDFGGSESSGGEEKRIAGQKRRHHESRFQEDDEEKEEIGPQAKGLDERAQMFVEMNDEIDQLREELHGHSSTDRSPALWPPDWKGLY
jgi:hypothetical protein